MARSRNRKLVAHQAAPKNQMSGDERNVPVTRDPALALAPVDMAIVGFMGRDFTVTGFASYPSIKSMTVDASGPSLGPNEVDYEHAYRETCSLRLAPASVGQFAFSLLNALRDSDPDAFEDFKHNLEEMLKDREESAH